MAHSHTPSPTRLVDVLVVGGGPAGLAAALVLGRSRRSVLVVDAGEPRNAPADGVHAFLTRDGTPPAELRALARKEVDGYGVALHDGRAVGAERAGDRFRVRLDDGSTVRARRLVLTTGLVDRLPDVDGLADRWGRDVVHCPYCHGWEVRDRVIGVLATSPMATHQAGLFRQLSDRVVLLRHTGPDPDPEALEGLVARGVEVVEGEVVGLDVRDDALAGVRLADGRTVAVEALAVAPAFIARDDLLADLGLAAVEHPSGAGVHVPADPTGRTEVPGVWVAGNVTDPMAQVIASAAQGNMAGAVVNADLVAEDTARAVARAAGDDASEWDDRYGDAPMWSGSANGALVAEAAALVPGSALDVGCGEGGDAIWLAQQGWQVTALDPSGVAIERGRAAAAAAGVDVEWVRAGLLEAAREVGVHDLVTVQYPAIRKGPDGAVVAALLGAVAPGGTLLVVHHEITDEHRHQHASQDVDPGDYVMPADVAAALDDGWVVEVDEVRDRVGPLPEDALHVRDIVLRARRR